MAKKTYRKVAVSSLAATAAVAAVAPAVSADAKEFTDVQPGDSHYDGIQWLAQNGIEGYEDGSFGVQNELTRPHAAIMFTRALGLDIPSADSVSDYFSDVDADDMYAKFIAAAGKAGVFKGNSNNNFSPEKNLTREQMASTLVNAFDLKSGDNHVDVNLDNVSPTHEKSVQILADLGITNQTDDFRPKETVTRGQFATFLHLSNEAVANPDVVDLAANANDDNSVTVTGEVHYGDAAHVVVTDADGNKIAEKTDVALNEKGEFEFSTDSLEAGDYTVKAMGMKDGEHAGEFESVEVTVEATQVTTVTADNAKEIKVYFSKPVDKDTIDSISVEKADKAENPGEITSDLSEDGKTLTLTASNTYDGDYTVTVPFESVKDINGDYVKPVNYDITVNDEEAPALQSAKATVASTDENVGEITLSFDEEVSTIEAVKINGEVQGTVATNGKTATVSGLNLDSSKEHNVTVVKAKDSVGNVQALQQTTLDVTVDSSAPTVTSVEAAGESSLTVTFDKELNDELAKGEITANVGTFTVDVVDTVSSDDSKVYTVKLNSDYLYQNGDSEEVKLTIQKDAVSDKLGNKNDKIEKSVTLNKDTVAPEVTATAKDGDEVTLTYSEDVDLASNPSEKVYIVNSKGKIQNFDDVVDTIKVDSEDASKVIVTLQAAAAEDEYGFELKKAFVTDKSLADHSSEAYSFSVNTTKPDEEPEETFTIASASAADNVITVDFGTDVKASGNGSALNPSNYSLDGNVLPEDTNIAFTKDQNAVNQKQVEITLPAGLVQKDESYVPFEVSGVENLDGQVNNSFAELIDVKDNTAPVAESFVATDLNKVTISYSEAVKTAAGNSTVTDEINLFDANGNEVTVTSSTVSDGKLVLTLNSEKASDVTKLTTLEVDSANADVKDDNGVAQKAGITVTK